MENSLPTVGGDKTPADIMADDVHALFNEFVRGKKRRRTIPNRTQCQIIANGANEIISKLNSAPNLESMPEYSPLLAAARREEDVLKAAKSLKSELNKSILALKLISFAEEPLIAIEAANKAQADFENMRQNFPEYAGSWIPLPLMPTRERDWAISAANGLESADDLLRAVEKYIAKHDRSYRESLWRVPNEIKALQKVTISALESAGWKNVSSDSDRGPVSFVVAALMTRITGKEVHPSKIRRLKPRQKKL
jgi:hypothetical protein